ncbi:MAG: (p)ppGpp synthetase [Hydrogenimonas sp.]|nr:MAG: (p)ppGpp synthetase [Hydrogenimonas sp.]
MFSKSKIDKAGKYLSQKVFDSESDELEAEIIFDEYRQAHLQPLTETTIQIQNWLSSYQGQYYIAQRLKRKPQILRKLRRFSVRLTQLQDIAGNRIIVDTNRDIDKIRLFIKEKLSSSNDLKIYKERDYRELGRDDTGYRALHIILEKNGLKIELQIRSSAQHYWSESIERTSVIYGYRLKENIGNKKVLEYFKLLSNVFYEIESGREPNPEIKIKLDKKREEAEKIINSTSKEKAKTLFSSVHDGVLKTLTSVESKCRNNLNNWILVFDWNSGSFINWEAIPRDPKEAYRAYSKNESIYSEEEGYEVVLIGSSSVSMIRKTHSHYFGIDGYDNILENLDKSIIGFSSRKRIDSGSRRILNVLKRRSYWGKRGVSYNTLKNHYCNSFVGFDDSLEYLIELGLILRNGRKGALSLRIEKQKEIGLYL